MGVFLSDINVYTRDPARAFAFYKNLGWKVVNEGDLNTDWFGAELAFDGLTVWIWNNSNGEYDVKNNFVLHCDDIHATFRELREKGYEVTAPKRMFYGDYEMKLFNADGNLLLFLGDPA